MQGKESIAVDLSTPEGLAIVRSLAARADVVLQSFRGDAATRLGIGPADLGALNPDLVYVNAPGYGTTGEWGARPAYAPSMGAAGGFALTDASDAVGGTGSLTEIKRTALRLNQATSISVVNADGVAAVAVGATILPGLLARGRGRPLGELTATMLGTATHAVLDRVVDYVDRPRTPTVDAELAGYSALYRLYPTGAGWVFLAAPTDRDWVRLAAALSLDDDRFATAAGRAEHDGDLADLLTGVFGRRGAAAWERLLTAEGIGCIEVAEEMPELRIQRDPELLATYGATAEHPVFAEHPRLGALVRLSRSASVLRGDCLAGDHTDALLTELGHDAATISRLRDARVVG